MATFKQTLSLLCLCLLAAAVCADSRHRWTQGVVAEYQQKFPGNSVMVVKTAHSIDSNPKIKDLKESVDGDTYKVYLIPFDAGRVVFVLRGDGGFGNWAFGGRWDRPGNGKTVIFNP